MTDHKRPEADALAEKYPHLGRCHRCKMPTTRTPRSAEPFLCGQCRHDIHEAAGRRAVRRYLANAR